MDGHRLNSLAQPVYFTFDDGPCQPYTSELLDVLAQHNAKATFFVCGANAEKLPDVVKKIDAAGHALGNHGYSHGWFKSYLGLLREEITRTDQILYQLTGSHPTLFRPPWGLVHPWIKKFTKKQGYRIVLWDIHAFDWFQPSVGYMKKRILKKIQPRSIILLHDGHNTDGKQGRGRTVELMRQILPLLADKNLYADRLM